MKLVIDIPEQMYLNSKADLLCGGDILVKAIKNGIPLCHNKTLTENECDRLLKAVEQREKIEQLLELYQDALARLCQRQRNNINDAIVDAMFSGKLSVYGIVIADLKGLLDESEDNKE